MSSADTYAVITGPMIGSDPKTTVLFFKDGVLEALRSDDRNFFGMGKCKEYLERNGADAFDFRNALGAPTYYDISTGSLNRQLEADYRRVYPISSNGQTPDPAGRTKHLRDAVSRSNIRRR